MSLLNTVLNSFVNPETGEKMDFWENSWEHAPAAAFCDLWSRDSGSLLSNESAIKAAMGIGQQTEFPVITKPTVAASTVPDCTTGGDVTTSEMISPLLFEKQKKFSLHSDADYGNNYISKSRDLMTNLKANIDKLILEAEQDCYAVYNANKTQATAFSPQLIGGTLVGATVGYPRAEEGLMFAKVSGVYDSNNLWERQVPIRTVYLPDYEHVISKYQQGFSGKIGDYASDDSYVYNGLTFHRGTSDVISDVAGLDTVLPTWKLGTFAFLNYVDTSFANSAAMDNRTPDNAKQNRKIVTTVGALGLAVNNPVLAGMEVEIIESNQCATDLMADSTTHRGDQIDYSVTLRYGIFNNYNSDPVNNPNAAIEFGILSV